MIKVKRHNETVYGYQIDCGLGDTWALTSYLLKLSERCRAPIYFNSPNHNVRRNIPEIKKYFDTTGDVKITNNIPKTIIKYCDTFRSGLLSTKKIWTFDPESKIVAYQFDGHHLSYEKNPSYGEIKFLIRFLKARGYKPVDIGYMKPLNFIIDTLSRCKFFIGCPSGMSIVSLSVGNPIINLTKFMRKDFITFMQDCQYQQRPDLELYTTVYAFAEEFSKKSKPIKLFM